MSLSQRKLGSLEQQSQRKIINSIIKQKLSSDILIIRENVHELIQKKGVDALKSAPRKPSLRKRTVSLSSKEIEKISKDHAFNPLESSREQPSATLLNVRKQMMESPLIDGGEELNRARMLGNTLHIKLGALDRLNYETNIEAIEERVKKVLSPRLYLPGKQYIQASKDYAELEELPVQNEPFKLVTQPSIQNIFVVETDGKSQPLQIIDVYDTKKYSKSDFKTLDAWFEEMIRQLKHNQPDYLEKVFSLYVSSLKELSRLLYLEDVGKGSLFNKLVWSFTHLFDQLMEKQHQNMYDQFKKLSKESKEMRELFEGRQNDIREQLTRSQRQTELFKNQRDVLAKMFMTYKTVNRELMFELEECSKMHKELKLAHEHLKSDHMKMLKHLNETDKILQTGGKYFVVNDYNKPQIISHFIQGKQAYDSFQEQTLTRQKYIQSQLAKFWDQSVNEELQIQKQLDYELHKYTSEEAVQTVFLNITTRDEAIQNYSCKSHVSDISLDEGEQFEGFLIRELKDKETDQTDNDALVLSLRTLYDQVYAQNLSIKSRNQRLEELNALENANNERILQEITKLRQQNLWQEAVVKETRLQSDGLYKEIAQKDEKIQDMEFQIKELTADLKDERFNNEIFVKNEIELKKKYEKLDRDTAAQIKELDSTIKKLKIKIAKGVAVFNDYLDLIQNNSDNRYTDIGNRIEEIFKEDLNREEKDVAGPFITK